MNIKRKIRKLIKSPELFFHDMLEKRVNNIKNSVLTDKTTESGSYSYTIVSAVYNVDKYINQYIHSVVKQSLSFENNIKLILVDDGSTDNSAEIIEKWKLKFPQNIIYIKKTNGGQASARNLGLEYIQTDWVTFIDPDDFISNDYFFSVDEYLGRPTSSQVQMVSCNFIPFHESKGNFIDNHPLNYRFKDGDNTVDLKNSNSFMQLSASSAFFRSQTIRGNDLIFDERVKPSFEDAHFVSCYMMVTESSLVGFLGTPKYYYRKRADNSSSLNTSWERHSLFNEVLSHGCLDVVEKAYHRYKRVPEYLQRTILYHLIWYFKRIINNESSLNHLDNTQKEAFKNLLYQLFRYIDSDVIMRFNLGGAWFFHKVGLISLYHQKEPDFQIVYVDQIDINKSQIKLRYFYHKNNYEVISLDGVDTLPVHTKTRKYDFLGNTFVNERILWVPISGHWQTLDIRVGGIETKLSFLGKHYSHGLRLNDVMRPLSRKKAPLPFAARALIKISRSQGARKKFLGSWLLMDRDIQADDNAEHLYRYLLRNHPKIMAYFVLRRNSHDWKRLKNEGFRLIAFGSLMHKIALLNCKHLVSSHADRYITNYLTDQIYHDITRFNYTFLQHGIIQNDLSGWLNTKTIAKFLTASRQEYASIINDKSKYKFTSKEVCLTGLPRHDALLEKDIKKEKIIVIMPTWRLSIVGDGNGKTGKRKLSTDFFKTDYARFWFSLLHSDKLKDISNQHHYEIVFFPHANIQPYLKKTRLPGHITILNHKDTSVQALLKKSSIMITDYSSVAFDFALLEKPLIYYQFDQKEIFNGSHTTGKGYFDYENDGFGKVHESLKEVLKSLEISLSNNCIIEDKYLARIRNTFPYRDGGCCERVVQEINDIEQPVLKLHTIQDRILKEYIDKSIANGNWTIAESRLVQLIAKSSKDSVFIQLIHVKRKLGKLDTAMDLIKYIENDISDINALSNEKQFINECQELLLLFNNPEEVINILKNSDYVFNEVNMDLAEVLYKNSLWEPLDTTCRMLSTKTGPDLGRLYFLWSIATKSLGKERLEMPTNDNQIVKERRSQTRPWASQSEYNNNAQLPKHTETTPPVVVSILK